MVKTEKDANELLVDILKTLKTIEAEVFEQGEDIKICTEKYNIEPDFDKRLVAQMKSTRTLVELLRDEIEELHYVMIALFRSHNHTGL